MKSEKILGYILLAVGLFLVVFPIWQEYSLLYSGRGLPQLIPAIGTDQMGIFFSNLLNILTTFSIFGIIVWAGSILSSRGVTLIREVSLKVARESVSEDILVVKKEEGEKPSS